MTSRMIATIGLAIAVAAALYFVHDARLLLQASVQDGLDQLAVEDVEVPRNDFRVSVVNALLFALSFLALAAIVTIVVAGFYFIVGSGSDAGVQRARKIILYTSIGLLVVLFSRVIVGFFTEELIGAIN